MSNRIRQLRLEHAKHFPKLFTVAALAHRVGVTEGMLRRWERGANRPSARHARALARELGVPIEALGLNDHQSPTTKDDGRTSS